MPRRAVLWAVLLAVVVGASPLSVFVLPTSHLGPSGPAGSGSEKAPSAANVFGLSPGHGTPLSSRVAPSPATLLARATYAGADPHDIFLPRALSAATRAAGTLSLSHVPLPYTSSPAPMGVADYGLRNASNGSVIPYAANTTRLVGTVDPYGPGIVPFYLVSGAPDSYAIQLDAVVTNVTLFGQGGYQFWVQDVLEYSVGRHVLTLVSNVWNFSAEGAVDLPNLLAAHGPNGHLVGYDVYYSNVTFANVVGPFDASLFLNSSVNASRDQVNFTAVVTGPSGTLSDPFDYVVFNSTAGSSVRFSNPANFTVNGFRLDPAGYTNDYELDIGGPGNGLQTNLYAADANLSLRFWNATAGVYRTVVSAESFGGDSGETASGASVAWVHQPGGPFGASTFAVMSSGPGLLHGLWNASTPSGAVPVSLALRPSNAWAFVELNATAGESNFSVVEPEWAPTELSGGSFDLSPGNYTLEVLESEFSPQTIAFTVGSMGVGLPVTLAADPAEGIYAPLYVWNDSQFAALSSSGAGTPSNPYVLYNVAPAPFAAEFGTLNDYDLPVYAGVLFANTNASVELYDPPSFATATPFPPPDTCPITLACLPDTNDLQYLFYNTSGVAVVDARNISGWFGTGLGSFSDLYPTLATDTMILWNSTHDLVAGNRFDLAAAGGIYLFGGGSNTLWGNLFGQGSAPDASPGALWPSFYGVGIQSMESHDLIYNDLFDNTEAGATAWTPILNPYTQAYKTWVDTWNVTAAPADTVRYASGFPTLPLSGSIVGTPDQGGSYWWDYGTSANPLPTLPYDASGYIAVGGDYHPLVPELSANFTETGLPSGTNWSVTLNGMHAWSNSSSIQFSYQDVIDTATFLVGSVPGFVAIPSTGNLTLNLTYTTNVTIRFFPDVGTLSGSVLPASAGVAVDGMPVAVSGSGTFSEVLPAGLHGIVATAPGYYPFSTNVQINFNQTTSIAIQLDPVSPSGPDGTLALTVIPATATIAVNGATVALVNGSYSAAEPPGLYSIAGTAPGYYPYFNNVTVVSNSTTTLTVRMDPITPIGPNGTIALTVSPTNASVWIDGGLVHLTGGHASISVAVGYHAVEATAIGYYPYFNNVSVESEGTTSLAIALHPVIPPAGSEGTLSVSVSPASASLWIDGKSTSLSSGSYHGAATAGVHAIEIQANGYYPYFNNVTVTSNRTTSLTVALDPYTASTTSTVGVGETGWVIIAGVAAVALIFFITTIVLSRRPSSSPAGPATPASPPKSPPSPPPPSEPPPVD